MSKLELVIAEGRSWIGTPWKHAARIRDEGIDCVNFLAAMAEVAGIDIDVPRLYLRTPERDTIYPYLKEKFNELGRIDPTSWLPGQLIVFNYSGVSHHVALVTGTMRIIHASLYWKRVIEEQIQHRDLKRYQTIFDIGLTENVSVD